MDGIDRQTDSADTTRRAGESPEPIGKVAGGDEGVIDGTLGLSERDALFAGQWDKFEGETRMSGMLKDLFGGKIVMVMAVALVGCCAVAFWWTKDKSDEPTSGSGVADVLPASATVSDENDLGSATYGDPATTVTDDGFKPTRVARPSLDGQFVGEGADVAAENENNLRAIPQSEPALAGDGPPSFDSPATIPTEGELPVQVAGQQSEAVTEAPPSHPLTHPLTDVAQPGFERPVASGVGAASTVEIPGTAPTVDLSEPPSLPTDSRESGSQDSFSGRATNTQGDSDLARPVESFGPRTLEPSEAVQPIVRDPKTRHPLATKNIESSGVSEQVHSVRSGDSYWTISRQYYGTARYFQALSAYNKSRVRNPRQMRPGMKVLVPSRRHLESRFASLVPMAAGGVGGTRTIGFQVDANGHPIYAVGADDTLTGIARTHLGRTSRWVQIYRMNRDQLPSPHKLKLGMVLRMPADAIRSEDGLR